MESLLVALRMQRLLGFLLQRTCAALPVPLEQLLVQDRKDLPWTAWSCCHVLGMECRAQGEEEGEAKAHEVTSAPEAPSSMAPSLHLHGTAHTAQ